MKRLTFAATVASLLSSPAAAQSLSLFLPLLAFPDPVTTASTMDGLPSPTVACPPQK